MTSDVERLMAKRIEELMSQLTELTQDYHDLKSDRDALVMDLKMQQERFAEKPKGEKE